MIRRSSVCVSVPDTDRRPRRWIDADDEQDPRRVDGRDPVRSGGPGGPRARPGVGLGLPAARRGSSRSRERLRVVVDGVTVAATVRGLRVLETAGAPVYYFPPEDVRLDLLADEPAPHGLRVEGHGPLPLAPPRRRAAIENVAWSYPDPLPGLRVDPRPRRVLCRSGRRGVGRRRAGDAAARRLLRRLGHVAGSSARSRASPAPSAGSRAIGRPADGPQSPTGTPEDVEAAVDVDDLAGHGRREVRGEVDRGPADVLDRDVRAERGDRGERAVHRLEPADARRGERPDRAGARSR